MYKLSIILRYLGRKLAPIFAMVAVMLCSAMVIIVVSIMGGFLDMMQKATKTLDGDLAIMTDITGFPYYEEMIAELRGMKGVVVEATPVVRGYGLLKLPDGIHKIEVIGVDSKSFARVVNYKQSLHWTSQEFEQYFSDQESRDFVQRIDPVELGMTFRPTYDWWRLTRATIRRRDESPATQPALGAANAPPIGIVPGIHVSRDNVRDGKGQYSLMNNSSLGKTAVLTVLQLSEQGGIVQPVHRQCVVVNEFKSGLFDIDANRAYVSFELLQQMLGMDRVEAVDRETGLPTGKIIPGRVTEILVKGNEAIPLEELKAAVERAVAKVYSRHPDLRWTPQVITWRQRGEHFLGAVENEKMLMMILFAIVSLVAFIMIAVVFSMIVAQKTRDIGTLRALGASQSGIAGIFLGYGLAIGVAGSGLGLAVASAIVLHINDLQAFLGNQSGTALFCGAWGSGSAVVVAIAFAIYALARLRSERWLRWIVTPALIALVVGTAGAYLYLSQNTAYADALNLKYGWTMWKPDVYYFDQIPSQLNPREVTWILLASILSSVLGALFPAVKASLQNPVDSLRFE